MITVQNIIDLGNEYAWTRVHEVSATTSSNKGFEKAWFTNGRVWLSNDVNFPEYVTELIPRPSTTAEKILETLFGEDCGEMCWARDKIQAVLDEDE